MYRSTSFKINYFSLFLIISIILLSIIKLNGQSLQFDSSKTVSKPPGGSTSNKKEKAEKSDFSAKNRLIGNSWNFSSFFTINRQTLGSFEIGRTYGVDYTCGGPCLPRYASYGFGYDVNLRHNNSKALHFYYQQYIWASSLRLDIIRDIENDDPSQTIFPVRIRPSLGIDVFYADLMISYTFTTTNKVPYKQGVGITLRARAFYKKKNWPFVKVG